MTTDKSKLLITVKPHGTALRPQQKTLAVTDPPWEIEWSTAPSLTMTVDFFNLTVGRVLPVSEDDPGRGRRRIEECWRVTHIPGHSRKVRYGVNLPETTSTSATAIADGVYAVKITAMSAITQGLTVESGVGAAIVRLSLSTAKTESLPQMDTLPLSAPSASKPVEITNETVLKFFRLLEEDDGQASHPDTEAPTE